MSILKTWKNGSQLPAFKSKPFKAIQIASRILFYVWLKTRNIAIFRTSSTKGKTGHFYLISFFDDVFGVRLLQSCVAILLNPIDLWVVFGEARHFSICSWSLLLKTTQQDQQKDVVLDCSMVADYCNSCWERLRYLPDTQHSKFAHYAKLVGAFVGCGRSQRRCYSFPSSLRSQHK